MSTSTQRKNGVIAGLLLLVVVSGIAVSYTTYESRRLHQQWQQLREHHNQVQLEWGRLLLEQRTLTALGRVEQIARNTLDMIMPPANKVNVLVQ